MIRRDVIWHVPQRGDASAALYIVRAALSFYILSECLYIPSIWLNTY